MGVVRRSREVFGNDPCMLAGILKGTEHICDTGVVCEEL